jgi:hypothetical protein
VISEYPIPTPNSDPQGITAGSDGNIWFTESIGKVGRLSLVSDTSSPDAHAICLGRRFRASVNWHTSAAADVATGIPLSGDAGAFWFFSANNIELAVKVVDGRPFNERFWLFCGSLTSVAFTLTVTDTSTGSTKTYTNPEGTLASFADTNAF